MTLTRSFQGGGIQDVKFIPHNPETAALATAVHLGQVGFFFFPFNLSHIFRYSCFLNLRHFTDLDHLPLPIRLQRQARRRRALLRPWP